MPETLMGTKIRNKRNLDVFASIFFFLVRERAFFFFPTSASLFQFPSSTEVNTVVNLLFLSPMNVIIFYVSMAIYEQCAA